jgi:hypothetical protein
MTAVPVGYTVWWNVFSKTLLVSFIAQGAPLVVHFPPLIWIPVLTLCLCAVIRRLPSPLLGPLRTSGTVPVAGERLAVVR